MEFKHTNALINESSPYLLQHAHNPVNWYAWSSETLKLAQKENKPLLISIGYSSCHWCHVMEHQSFEDEEVAKIMNEHFICIKVDREEHPDVDQIYMNAVQLISGSGGWPLNCFALPDGRPFYGGTYFPKDRWISLLKQLSSLYTNDYPKVLEYAENLENGIKQSEQVIKISSQDDFKKSELDNILNSWVNQFDDDEGGPNREPKFPLPNNYSFLMHYAWQEKDKIMDDHIRLTLDKMSNGGIYDQLGGGFARYSVDRYWKVPHFEKMLYDNAQLVSLYSEAYKNYKDENYKRIISETLEFIKREMTNDVGLFYAALDADSEGEEGKFYVWKLDEIQSVLKDQAALFIDYYQMNNIGFWEKDNYILMRVSETQKLQEKHKMTSEQIEIQISQNKQQLMLERDTRVRPGLDDKSLLSWNAMMITAYCDAYSAIGNEDYKNSAITAIEFILKNMLKEDGSLWHTYKAGESKIDAYLDDYALLIQALLKLYETGLGDQYLIKSQELTEFTITKFLDKKTGMFFFTSSDQEVIVTRKTELFDNVIPASNSVMARNLLKLSHFFENESYDKMSKQMLHNVKDKFASYGSSLSNWGILMMEHIGPSKEVVICGSNSYENLQIINLDYFPNVTWAISDTPDQSLSIFKGRWVVGKTLVYVCVDNTCQLPLEDLNLVKGSIIK